MVNQVTASNSSKYERYKFCIEASDLGITAGNVLMRIPTTLGNQQEFLYHSVERNGAGDVDAWIYRQRHGCLWLRVFND